MFKKISLATLGELSNGSVAAMVDKELQRAVTDLAEAGEGDDAVRKVVIVVELSKEKDQAAVTVKAQAKLPALKSGTTAASMRKRAKVSELVFQDLNPDSPDQASFDDVPPEKPKDE